MVFRMKVAEKERLKRQTLSKRTQIDGEVKKRSRFFESKSEDKIS